jgi:nucleotide-binding universal stress UspA family protein
MRILMPVDGSQCSDRAVDFVASRISSLRETPEIAMITVQHPVPMRAAQAVGREIVEAHHAAEAARLFDPRLHTLRSAGAQVSARYEVGAIGQLLMQAVQNEPADLLVMSTHGETGLAHLLFGSVTETVAASCRKPLLILREDTPTDSRSLNVGLALDGSGQGLAAARFLAAHADLLGPSTTIALIHVAPELSKVTVHGWRDHEVATGIPADQVAVMHEAAFKAAFEPAHAILREAGLNTTEVRLVGNDPGALIAAHAKAQPLDLLAMGSAGFGTHRFSRMGSVAMRAAARSGAALLIVREPDAPTTT